MAPNRLTRGSRLTHESGQRTGQRPRRGGSSGRRRRPEVPSAGSRDPAKRGDIAGQGPPGRRPRRRRQAPVRSARVRTTRCARRRTWAGRGRHPSGARPEAGHPGLDVGRCSRDLGQVVQGAPGGPAALGDRLDRLDRARRARPPRPGRRRTGRRRRRGPTRSRPPPGAPNPSTASTSASGSPAWTCQKSSGSPAVHCARARSRTHPCPNRSRRGRAGRRPAAAIRHVDPRGRRRGCDDARRPSAPSGPARPAHAGAPVQAVRMPGQLAGRGGREPRAAPRRAARSAGATSAQDLRLELAAAPAVPRAGSRSRRTPRARPGARRRHPVGGGRRGSRRRRRARPCD